MTSPVVVESRDDLELLQTLADRFPKRADLVTQEGQWFVIVGDEDTLEWFQAVYFSARRNMIADRSR